MLVQRGFEPSGVRAPPGPVGRDKSGPYAPWDSGVHTCFCVHTVNVQCFCVTTVDVQCFCVTT